MREVDEALARAYAQREKGRSAAGRAAGPSLARPCVPGPTTSGVDRDAGPRCGTGDLIRTAEGDRVRVILQGDRCGTRPELQWPAVVLTLEREWGDRFERMAEFLFAVPAAAESPGHPLHQLPSGRRPDDPGAGPGPSPVASSHAAPCSSTRTSPGPMLARLLGLRPAVGLDDVVEDGRALSDALIDAPDDHLAVLPMRGAVATAPRLPHRIGLDLLPGPAPPRVRPDPPRWRPAVHRLERGHPPSLRRRRRARPAPRPY